jgi:RNA polymerase sigma-70 factor (ECF subfamily)
VVVQTVGRALTVRVAKVEVVSKCALTTPSSRTVTSVMSGSPVGVDGWRDATDDELARGLMAGDERCLEEIYRRWARRIHSLAYRLLGSASDADDVLQQVFVGAWHSRGGYQPDSGSLPGWLLGIAKHRIVDRQRSRARELRLVGAVTNQTGAAATTEPLADLVDELVLMDEVQRLPPPRGTILRLAFWEGQTYAQIAERLELPLGTVKSHARRAMIQLRARLEEVRT